MLTSFQQAFDPSLFCFPICKFKGFLNWQEFFAIGHNKVTFTVLLKIIHSLFGLFDFGIIKSRDGLAQEDIYIVGFKRRDNCCLLLILYPIDFISL